MKLSGVTWNEEKARKNLEKHGVSFETAQYVFSDQGRLERFDRSEENISGEERWQALGKVGDTLLVVYAETGIEKRLITARLATKAERKSYEGYYTIDGKGWTNRTKVRAN
ncbi:BrnT family toxin [Treponema primitia]|uniref:BrnT family toxin n=1 Tax=Treponema primitia TaxID=88058 RepID=UPI00397F3C79